MTTHSMRPWPARLPFFYGWIIVGLGFFSAFFGIGMTWAAGLFAVPMHTDLGWSRASIFFAVSLRGWMGIVVTPLVGPYLDRRNGPQILAVVGGLMNTATLGLISFVNAQWQFALLFGVLGGVAQAAQSGISVAIVPKWFVKRRGSAVSISTLGGGLAAFVMPALVATLSDAAGWRTAWAVLGGLAFAVSTLPAVLLRRQPEDVGLLPDGDRSPSTSSPRGAFVRLEGPSFTLREALHTSAFWMLMIGVSIGGLSNNGIPSNMAAIFVDRGFSFKAAGAALMWYGIASITSKFVWGWVANRFRLRTVLLLLTLYGMFALPAILFIPTRLGSLSLGYGFVVGLFVGGYVPLAQLVWADYFGRAHLGSISSVGRPLGIISMSGGPFLLASLRDLSGSYTLGISVNALAVALCFACVLLVRSPASFAGLQSAAGSGMPPREKP